MKLVSGLDGSLVNWNIDLLKDVMSIDNLIAVKEDAKDEDLFKKILEIEFDGSIIISGGGKKRWLSYSDTSCQSWLNGIGTFLPKIPKLFWENYLNGNSLYLERIINEIEKPFFDEIVNKFGWHTSARASLHYFGHMGIYERMPMTYLDINQYKVVKNFFDRMKLDEFV
jgi:dihydrodipicolinate synthase/N-acetylneuraminate lyase